MIKELKRAIFNYRFLFVILLSLIMFGLSSYHSVWMSALKAPSATDLNDAGRKFVLSISANKYNIWTKSFRTTSILFPILISLPYLFSYADERENNFRYFMYSRQGIKKYLTNKVNAICISGGLVLFIPQIMYSLVLSIVARPVIYYPFDYRAIGLIPSLYDSNPELYILMTAIIHFVFGYAFTAFAIGVTSFFKNKATLLIMPFISTLIFDMTVSLLLKQEGIGIFSAYKFMHIGNYTFKLLISTCIVIYLMGLFIIIGVEKWRFKNG